MRTPAFILLNCLLLPPLAYGQTSEVLPPASQVSAFVDKYFAQAWETERVVPAGIADDYEFLRRLSLDLTGRIPAVSQIREFHNDSDVDKRSRVVELLLDDPAYVRHATTLWRNALIPQANSQVEFRGLIPGFEAWLWQHLSAGSPYDVIVREIIAAELNAGNGPALSATTSPDAFFLVRDLKPENLAAGTARAFLGVRLDCAQCHDHPFDNWNQRQFWNLAAFYSGFNQSTSDDDGQPAIMNVSEDGMSRVVKIPGTNEVVPALFLTGVEPAWSESVRTRDVLAEWMTSADNPWFARMAVNRLWAQFFGRGLVDPLDDFSENNPPSHPDVLQILSQDFINSSYDMQRLARVIAGTTVYQRTSQQTHPSQQDTSQFARSVLRGLTPEQLFDSLAEAVGYYQPYRSENPFVVDTDSPRAMFFDLFRESTDSPLEHETTILQALALMNGEFVGQATSFEQSRTLRAVIDFPAMSSAEKLETLYLATVSRPPSAKEQQRYRAYLETTSENQALGDIFWALLNSSEFLLNH